jgi:hypothetical protein
MVTIILKVSQIFLLVQLVQKKISYLYPQFYISNLYSMDLQLMVQPVVALEITEPRIFAL